MVGAILVFRAWWKPFEGLVKTNILLGILLSLLVLLEEKKGPEDQKIDLFIY